MNSMLPLKGFLFLLLFQCLGELIARIFHLPFPGQVLGLLLLACALTSRTVNEPVQACANILLSHLQLLFIPVAVGLMTQWDNIRQYGIQLFFVLTISCFLGIWSTAIILNFLLKQKTLRSKNESTLDREKHSHE